MKILFVFDDVLLPVNWGPNIVVLETLRSMEEACELHLLTPAPRDGHESYARSLEKELPNVVAHFYQPKAKHTNCLIRKTRFVFSELTGRSYHEMAWRNRSLRDAVNQLLRTERIDVVHCEWLPVAVSLIGIDRPILLRTIDVMSEEIRLRLDAPSDMGSVRRMLWRRELQRLRSFEVASLRSISSVVTLSVEDEQFLRSAGIKNVATIPPPFSVPPLSRPTKGDLNGKVGVLFTGRMEQFANRMAFFNFAEKIWAHVGSANRDRVDVCFAGGAADEAVIHAAAKAGIRIMSELNNDAMNDLYNKSKIIIAPVECGTGIKIKTLGAMARGKAVVGYPNAFRGIPVVDRQHAVIAQTERQFAACLETVANDDGLRSRLGLQARALIESHFNPQRISETLLEEYQSLMAQ